MNIQNKLIYLHFPKTGGRYVSEQLIEHNVDILENIRDKSLMPMKHFKWSDISNNVNNNQTLFSIIRNPYTWYVSYYFHHLYHEKTFDYWKNLTDETIKTDFKEWLVNNKNVYTNLVKDFLPESATFFKFENLDEINDFFKDNSLNININFDIDPFDYTDHAFFKFTFNDSLEKFKHIDFMDDNVIQIINYENRYIFDKFNYNYKRTFN